MYYVCPPPGRRHVCPPPGERHVCPLPGELRTPLIAILILIAGLAPALAQHPQEPNPHRSGDSQGAIERHFFAPELIMAHQQDIALRDDQREAIKTAVQDAQATVHEVQWDMQAEARALEQLVASATIDEAAVLDQADRVMDLEKRIKKTHLSLVIRIKNTLTAEQQAKLRQLRQGR